MEKDHFKDRTQDTTRFSRVGSGKIVFICEKEAQKYAKDLKDLTAVRVASIFTRHDHPRGIKVEGRVYEYIGSDEGDAYYEKTDRKAKGRIVYFAEAKRVFSTDEILIITPITNEN